MISVRPHRVRIHLHFRWKGWQYKKPSCFWYVRGCNGSGIWERKWQGTEGDHSPPPSPSLSSAVCTGKQMKATREANTSFYWNMGTKCCDPNFQKRRWPRASLIYQHCFMGLFVDMKKGTLWKYTSFDWKINSSLKGKRVKRESHRYIMSHDVCFFFEEHVHRFTRYVCIEVRESSGMFTWLDLHSGLFALSLYDLQILTGNITPPG